MIEKNVSAPAPHDGPRGETRRDYLGRLAALPDDLRHLTATVAAKLRATTPEIVTAAESIAWMVGIGSVDDLADALTATVRAGRSAR
jgi:hypothetical protein